MPSRLALYEENGKILVVRTHPDRVDLEYDHDFSTIEGCGLHIDRTRLQFINMRPRVYKKFFTVNLIQGIPISEGYLHRRVFRYDKYLNKFPPYGTGIYGFTPTRYENAHGPPDSYALPVGHYFLIYKPLVGKLLDKITGMTFDYILGKDGVNIEILTLAWNILLSTNEPVILDEENHQHINTKGPLTEEYLSEILDSWLYLKSITGGTCADLWVGFNQVPADLLPSPVTVVFYMLGYNSILTTGIHSKLKGGSVLFPPYLGPIYYHIMGAKGTIGTSSLSEIYSQTPTSIGESENKPKL